MPLYFAIKVKLNSYLPNLLNQFIAILKLVFSPHTKKAYASQIIFNLIPHLDTPEQLLNLSVILLNSDEPLYEQYVAQYSHALALNL